MQNKTVKSHKIRNIKTLRCTKNKYSEKNIKKKKNYQDNHEKYFI